MHNTCMHSKTHVHTMYIHTLDVLSLKSGWCQWSRPGSQAARESCLLHGSQALGSAWPAHTVLPESGAPPGSLSGHSVNSHGCSAICLGVQTGWGLSQESVGCPSLDCGGVSK